MWIPFDAILIRHQWETWEYAIRNNLNYWTLKYGKGSDREKLRDLIYNHTNLDFLYLAKNYDLIFLSMNFDKYPSSADFRDFVNIIVGKYYYHYPNKEIITGAGNETWEKVHDIGKFLQIVKDTADGVKQYNLPICIWNEKIYTSEEKEAFNTLLNNSTIKSICKYVGYQSLGTRACDLATYIRYAKNLGYEPVDTEMGRTTEQYSELKQIFDIDRINGVDKVFILTPYVSRKLCKEYPIWEKYALAIVEE